MKCVRDHLLLLIPDHVRLDGLARVWEEARPEMCLEEGFRCIITALKHLVTGERNVKEMIVSDTEDIEEDVGKLQDEIRALQSHCEECDNALADAR